MTADWLQGLRGAGSGRNTWKADAPDRLVPAPALWADAPSARMRLSVGLLCGLRCGIHASTLAHSGRPEALFSEAFGRSQKWRMGELTGGEGGILCQGPKDLENCSKISVSGQPRLVVCTGSMYRNRRLGSSAFRGLVSSVDRLTMQDWRTRICSGTRFVAFDQAEECQQRIASPDVGLVSSDNSLGLACCKSVAN